MTFKEWKVAFIFGLFNDTVSSSTYIPINDVAISEQSTEKDVGGNGLI
jgi:hypothetical protein